jgi:hypothetical protein
MELSKGWSRVCLPGTIYILLTFQAGPQVILPDHVQARCSFVAQQSDPSTGLPLPPRNTNFNSSGSDCEFYNEAMQMFFWLTSPAPVSYGGGSYVFASKVFYAVSTRKHRSSAFSHFFQGSGQNPAVQLLDITLSQTGPKGRPVVFDRRGSVHEDGVGQAGTGEVLLTQGRDIVFYGILINDVYLYYHDANPHKSPIEFPDTKGEVDRLSKKYNHVFPDAEALAVALKTAWIEVKKSEKSRYENKYITVEADVPVYDKRSKYVWRPVKKRAATLALVGMHVAFSATKQRKMIWATFEHVDNTRNQPYEYTADNSGVCPPRGVCRGEDSRGAWVFSKAAKCNNHARMHANDNGWIIADHRKTIAPSNICRYYAWGSDEIPDNTNSISIDKSFIRQLPTDDVRRNYIMIGTNWYVPGGDKQGGSKLGNSTMETFIRESRCLGCHAPAGLSHIWDQVPHPPKR